MNPGASRGAAGSRPVVVGAGIGGLAAALRLASAGRPPLVVEQAAGPGGKMRTIPIGGRLVDAGPTVFTMRWVFDELLASAGLDLDDVVRVRPANLLARHAWRDGGRLDLFVDTDRSAAEIEAFAGAREAEGYARFVADSAEVFETLRHTFIAAGRTDPIGLGRRIGLGNVRRLAGLRPFSTLWTALGSYFQDPRLRQLFGRYATYCGSSPFAAPATLMLVAHVEQAGVWLPDGGMAALARGLTDAVERLGGEFAYGVAATEIEVARGRAAAVRLADGRRLQADAVVFNGDAAALPTLLDADAGVGRPSDAARSLSAIVWTAVATAEGFPLARHTVFFSDDYAAEFDDIFRRRRPPDRPTVYVCAQDRDDAGGLHAAPGQAPGERLLILINAPPNGDRPGPAESEMERCKVTTFKMLAEAGLTLRTEPVQIVATTPADFSRLFPATGGALYGRASHGWKAAFERPGATTRIPGLFLAGGSVHPGPGVPMAAMSGMLAAERAAAFLASTR